MAPPGAAGRARGDPGIPSRAARCLVDAHVHLHPRFPLDRSLGAARRNLAHGRHERGLPEETPGVLLVADPPGEDSLDRLGDALGRGGLAEAGWSRRSPAGRAALRLRHHADPAELVLVGGRQIRTDEGLELLVFPATAAPAGEPPIEPAARDAAGEGALVVLPWGFLKWTGGRRERVRRLIETSSGSPGLPVALADSATRARTAFGPEPRIFRAAAARAVPVLAGTDPLPLRGEEARIGSFGVELRTRLDPESSPVESIRDAVHGIEGSPPRFGRRLGAFHALRLQLRLRLGGIR